MDVNPALILYMWTGGLAGGAAVVGAWRIVGPGFTRLVASIVALFGTGAVYFGGGGVAWLAVAASVVGGVAARRRLSWLAFVGAALGFAGAAAAHSPLVPVATGLGLLGGISTEMLLGHWYLIDPRLPRWALQRLALASGIALLADVAYVAARGGLRWVPADAVTGWAFVAVSAMTALLVAAVWFALREPNYTGVMAATGLSYLAVLTSFGVVVVGRLLIAAG